VNYTGWLYETTAADNKGRQFDTSAGRGPLAFALGTGAVIRGWDQGVVGMRVGGQRRLVIPPSLAYGAQGAGNGLIPPNATLLFDIELVDVQ
jgi:FKBP-type peptidyl-prolyl cis-trans isomerase FkpA